MFGSTNKEQAINTPRHPREPRKRRLRKGKRKKSLKKDKNQKQKKNKNKNFYAVVILCHVKTYLKLRIENFLRGNHREVL